MPILRLRDDLGRDLTFAKPPSRIVSLVPSDTHSLCALGLADRLVGRTRYCDLDEVSHVPAICGTKDLDVEAIIALAPELVVANQEENSRAPLEALAQRGVRVLVSLPRRVEEGLSHLARLAKICGVERAPAVVELIARGYRALAAPAPTPGPRSFVPIWLDPLMTFNGDTFGSDVLARCGVGNAFAERLRLYPLAADLGKSAPVDAGGRDERYPRVSFEEVRRRAPELVLLPDEPYSFTDDDVALFTREVPGARVLRVSGRDLFWYGAWSIDALPRLASALGALGGN